MSDRVRLGLSELSEVPCPPRPQQSDGGTMAGALAAGFQFTSNLSHLPHMRSWNPLLLRSDQSPLRAVCTDDDLDTLQLEWMPLRHRVS